MKVITISLLFLIITTGYASAQCHLITSTQNGIVIKSTPDLYFYTRSSDVYQAVDIKMLLENRKAASQLKFDLKITTDVNTKPVIFGVKFADDSNLYFPLRHTHKSVNDNKRIADDNFEVTLTKEDIGKIKTLHVKSWLISAKNKVLVADIPVEDDRNIQEQLGCITN